MRAITILFSVLFLGFSQLALAATSPVAPAAPSHFKGFVEVQKGRELYVDYLAPAPGRPTMVLLNGLTYRVGSWDSFVSHFEDSGIGVLQYDPMGQGETLLKYAPATDAFMLADQVSDLENLLVKLKVKDPLHFVGLSYGGALGMAYAHIHPERIETLILMAPFVAPLQSQDVMIKQQILTTRIMFPFNPASDDELYDYFLKNTIYTTYPFAEPIVLENPYKLEATFRLVQGIRKFLAKDIVAKLPLAKVHLMMAKQDQYLDNSVHDEFWNELPAGVRASRIVIDGTEHKIPEAIPAFSSAWVRLILERDPRLTNGRAFTGSVWNGNAVSDQFTIDGLEK